MKLFEWLDRWHTYILLAIIALAAVLRIWNLGDLPHGFHNDEVLNGYVGRYILENGVDLYGNRWPVLYFDHFGDYPNVLPMYFSGIFTLIFGVTPFAVRFPIALMGVLTVLLVYLFGRWLWKPRWVALIPAAALAVLPWHIVLSRATAEGITASGVFLLGLFLLFSSLDNKKIWQLVVGTLCLLGTYLLYPGFRVLVPLTVLPLVLLAPKKTWRTALIGITIFFFAITLLISQTVWGRGRYEQTSIWTHNNTLEGRSLNYSISLGSGRVLEARLFHNVPLLGLREFIKQYSSYFSPQYLFSAGGFPERYLVPEHGQLYWTFAIVFFVVIFLLFAQPLKPSDWQNLFQNERKKYTLFLLWVLAISPVPAALTLDDVPNVHRTAVMSILLCFLVGIGFYIISTSKKWGKWIILGLLLAMMAETIYFWHFYSNLYSQTSSVSRKDQQQVLANWLIQNKNNFDRIYLTGNELITLHYLFKEQRFPIELAGAFKEGIKLDSLDSMIFVKEDCVLENNSIATESGKVAIVIRSECELPLNYTIEAGLRRFNDTDAYTVLTNQVKQ